jgi:hypothetical protein
MSHGYMLFRLKERLPEGGAPLSRLDDSSTLPFSPMDDVVGRLAAIPGMERLSAEAEAMRAEATRGFLPEMELPVCVEFNWNGPSRELTVRAFGDPVSMISIERSEPWDFLPIVDAFGDLAPFVLATEIDDRLVDPEQHRPRGPRAREPVLRLAPASGGRRSGGLLAERWRVEGDVYLPTPFIHTEGRLVLALGDAVTVLDAASGETIWTLDCGRPMRVAAAPGLLLLAGSHPDVFAVSLDDGSVLGERRLDGETYTSPVVFGDGLAAVPRITGGWECVLWAMRIQTGEVLWGVSLSGATTVKLHAADQCLLVAAGSAVYSLDPLSGESLGSIGFAARGCMLAPAAEMASILRTGLFLHPWSLTRLSLPTLRERETVLEFPQETMLEHFLARIGPDLIAVGSPVDRENAKLTVLEAPGFDVRYEIDIQASPSPPAVLGPDRWACLLRPLRERRDQEAEVIIIETSTGRILHREPLGCRGWYPGHVAAGEMLFATYQHWHRDGMTSGIRAFELGESA